MAKLLQCDLHDYLEIACMYQYRVELELLSGQRIVGTPKTTKTSSEKREFLVFIREDKTPIEIETSELSSMTVLTRGAKFERVVF
ncbi:Rho-binding antiterminator [Litoribacillus peritrichatus]|uniref:Rho-binding antiterminator n=1 Tax=Litoribacillus peritrichatus TaxID=718191 RepID=A0ABP7MV93_9GAMM